MLSCDIQTSDVFDWNYHCEAPVVVNQGGTSSGKTYSILQVLFCKAIQEPEMTITVAGQDIPNLKVGALRDAETIVNSTPIFQQEISSFNKTDRIYKFRNGSVIEFNSYDDQQDAKSGKRDYLFINEANGIPYLVAEQLMLRTKKQVFIDYNPSEEFWVHEYILKEKTTQLFISDHRHNPFCPDSIRAKIEALKDKDPELYKVYARGLTGKIEGLVYRDWDLCDGIPFGATLIADWLDFGFTNDPTSFGQVYTQNGELWVDELIYEPGLTNPDIAERLRSFSISRGEDIIADSSEPKSIQEICNLGFNVIPVVKGPDSIRLGINILKRYKINITRRSHGIKKEIKSYKWKTNKATGLVLNEPIDFNNHSLDGLRYVGLMKLGHNQASGQYSVI